MCMHKTDTSANEWVAKSIERNKKKENKNGATIKRQ